VVDSVNGGLFPVDAGRDDLNGLGRSGSERAQGSTVQAG